VINSFGCKDSITKKVTIQPKANAAFQINATQGCAPFSLQVNNSSLYANIFKWFVDGNLVSVASNPNPLQLSIPAKTYIIKLVADHTLGCGIDSTVLQFTTYPKPIADFQIPVTSSCSGVLNINCFDLSSVAGGSIKKWNWSFGDGKTDTIQNPSHSYNISGAFSVSLWVKDDKDCVSDVAFKTVKNFGKPKANFAVGNVCLGSDAVPVNLSSTGFGSTSITSYLWNFGDGTFLTGNQPIHKYNTEGVYTITLTITADSSCVADTISKKITVYGKPTASFSFGNTCVNQITQFNNLSLFGFEQTSIGNSNWFFGDGLTSNINNPTHIYTASNSYNVKLQVSGNRCPNLIDTITKTIVINQPRNSVVYPRIDGTRGTPIQLNAANNGIAYQWLPSTALDNAFIQNPIANFAISSPNIVNYQIKITDSFGCVATDKQEVWLFAGADIFLPTAFTPNGDNANDLFKPLYINIQKIQYFRVFDRWGKIVFETSDMSKSWDGTLTGKELPTDTYVWSIAGFTNDGAEIIRKGNVTLIRN
jgi:gliding motility-associated-like protein